MLPVSSPSNWQNTSSQIQASWLVSGFPNHGIIVSGEWPQLAGGFSQFEKYESNWIISTKRGGENKKYLKPQMISTNKETSNNDNKWH